MAKKNDKSYSGKSYTVSANNKTKQKVDKKPVKKKEDVVKKPIALQDTSGVDGYFRPEVAVGRFKLGYEVFMGNFMKIIGLNFMMVLFLAPLFLLLFLRISTIYANASVSPFSANMGVGYLPYAAVLGLEESIIYYANYNFFMWLPLASLVIAVGLSGGMYVMRNLCWGESVNVLKTFWQGIKKNVLPMLATAAIYSIILSLSFMVISHIDLTIAVSGFKWYYVLFKVLLYVLIGFSSIFFLTMASMIVTYKGNYFALMKNSLTFTVILLPLNLFFAVFALLPFAILLLGTQAISLAAVLIMFLGASFTMLVWTVYSQWIYDKFVKGRVKSYEATEDEIKKHDQREQQKTSAKEEEGYTEVGKAKTTLDKIKPVTDYDVTISDVGEVFTREDIDKLNQSKNNL